MYVCIYRISNVIISDSDIFVGQAVDFSPTMATGGSG